MVEPTTENGGQGYKYIRAYFSSALTSLDADDIEIRNKKNNQLYSVDTVKLSADGKSADITLYGSVQEGQTAFLDPATIYTMAITQDGVTATYEFELPANASDEIVTAVDVENSTITVVPSGRTNAGTVDGEFAIGDVYDGDISGLVGRTVNIGTNSDNKVVKISVNDENVVTGKMKYLEGKKSDAQNSAVANLKDSYFEDVLTGDKYYFSSTNTSNVNYTKAFKAWNGDEYFGTGDDGNGNLVITTQDLPGNRTAAAEAYDYVQLTLNTNGTVAVAMVDPRWTSNILVNDVDDTIVVESEKMTLDVDGYTIVKNGVYVDPEDLEEGDVLYYDTTNKFAEVYNDEVTGTIEKVTSEKITIDGEKYNWDGAKYYNSSSKAYDTLDGTADNVGAQKYLNSLSTEDDVTIILNRGGSIAYITGTEEETVSDTKTVLMTNRLGQAYAQDLKNYAMITLSDGSDKSVRVDLSKLTTYAGKELESGGAKIHEENAAQPWKTTLDFDFTVASGKADLSGVYVGSGTATGLKDTSDPTGEFPIGALVKVTTNSDDEVIGLEKLNPEGIMQATSADDDSTRPQLESTDKTIKANGKVLALNGSTRIWVIDKDLNVKKVAFSDYNNKTEKGNANLVSVYSDGTKASDIVIDNRDGDAYSEATEDYVAGIVTDVQKAANGSSNEVAEITIMQNDGVEYTYDGTGKKNGADPANGAYVVLTLDKDTDELHDDSSIATFAWTNAGVDTNNDGVADLYKGELVPGRGSNATTLYPETGTKTFTLSARSGALILKRTDENKDNIYEYSPIEIGTINASTNKLDIYWHAVDVNDLKMAADIIIVEEQAVAEAGVATLKPITGALAQNDVIGTWTDNQPSTAQSTTGILQIKNKTSGLWEASGATVTIDGNNIKISNNYQPLAEREYRLLITHVPANTAFTDAASNTVKTAAAEKSSVAQTAPTKVTADTVTITGTAITPATITMVLDQFGRQYKTKEYGITDKATGNIIDAVDEKVNGVASITVDDTGNIKLKVDSIKDGRAIDQNDTFKILGCTFTITGYTGPQAITDLTTGSFVSEDTTTLAAKVDQTFDLGLSGAGAIRGSGEVHIYESDVAGGADYTDITSKVKTWVTTGSVVEDDNNVDESTTDVRAVFEAKRGFNYKFEIVSADEMNFTSVGIDDTVAEKFDYVDASLAAFGNFTFNDTTGVLSWDGSDVVGQVTVTVTKVAGATVTNDPETFLIAATAVNKKTVTITTNVSGWTTGDQMKVSATLDESIFGSGATISETTFTQ